MKGAIETREVITLTVAGVCVRGTYHKPKGESCDSVLDEVKRDRIGILFWSWVSPRSGPGDSAVYWADSLAEFGYLAFRFDRLGDSDVILATPGLDVESGAYAPALAEIADQLVGRYHLRTLIIAGNCAAAVTVLYAAAANECINGLILMDPYFHVPQDSKERSTLHDWHVRLVEALAWDRIAQPNLRAATVKALSCMRGIYHCWKNISVIMRRNRLPSNANLPLIRCWNQLAARRIRMLILRSPTTAPRSGEFDYIGFLQPHSDSHCRITVKIIERAGAVACTRTFAERHGKEAVRTNAEQWLHAYFPLSASAEAPGIGQPSPELPNRIGGMTANVH